MPIYYSSQFAPLIVFFLLFLAIVKNNKLHHFVRFNCMQARSKTVLGHAALDLASHVPCCQGLMGSVHETMCRWSPLCCHLTFPALLHRSVTSAGCVVGWQPVC